MSKTDAPETAVEVLHGSTVEVCGPTFQEQVFEVHRNKCSNCGSDDRLRVRLVVPQEAGGLHVLSNAVLLCRACEMAQDTVARKGNDGAHRPVNFWVSRDLYEQVKSFYGFSSMGALVRYLIEKYSSDSSRFDDLEMYQEAGNDVKINVWVGHDEYSKFKDLVAVRGLSVTDALKSLLRVYGAEAEPLVKSNRS